MSRLRGFLHRLRALVAPDAYAREIEREMHEHLELDAMQLRAGGASPDAARSFARRRFGNATHLREEVRRVTGAEWLDPLTQDVRYAIRGLRRAPGFTVLVALTLGLGLGANGAMFAFLDRLLFRAPPGIATPGEIRRLYIDQSRLSEPDGRYVYGSFLYPEARAIRAAVGPAIPIGLFESRPDSVHIKAHGRVVGAMQSAASAGYFRALGLHPAAGRFFERGEDRVESPTPVVVISHDLWLRAFDGAASAIGDTLRLQSRLYTVIGVTPAGFSGIDTERDDLWIPINLTDVSSGDTPWYETSQSSFELVTRVPSNAVEQRLLDIATIAERGVHVPRWGYDSSAVVRAGPIIAALGPVRASRDLSIAIRLGGVSLMVLLLAIANVATLLLVRSTRRAREIALRLALGVSRRRLLGQLLTESVLLAAIGATTALVFADWGSMMLRRLLLPGHRWQDGVIDGRVLIFAAVLALLTGMVAGLAPAIHAVRGDLANALRAGRQEGAYRRSMVRTSLVVAQVAVSLILVIGAGLFVQSLRNVHDIDIGYDRNDVLLVTPRLFSSGSQNTLMGQLLPAMVERLRSLPGIAGVAYSGNRPMGTYTVVAYGIPGRAEPPKLAGQIATIDWVSNDYFRVAGIPILAGHAFEGPEHTAPYGVVVSRAMARVTWPGENALGKCLTIGRKCAEVVGIVGDVHRMSMVEAPAMSFYLPNPGDPTTLLVRALHGVSIDDVKRTIAEALPSVPGVRSATVSTFDDHLASEFRPWRVGATLFSAMGVLALLVAGIGVYSVVSYTISQRTREMGIRIALGGRSYDIVLLVMGESARPVAAGLAGGILLALALGGLVSSQLYGLTAHDPAVFATALAALAVVGAAASLLPAVRATRVPAAATLRAD